MTPLIAEMVKLAPDPEQAHWFDMGDASKRPIGHVPDADMLRLPYPICCIVGRQADSSAFVLRIQSSDTAESLSVVGFVVGPGNSWKFGFDPILIERTEGGLQVSTLDGKPPEGNDYRGMIQNIEDFLLSLQQKSQTAYVPKARKSLINSRRAAKGKGPALFDWHTVVITPAQASTPHQGGTHASPRLHDRRGHWRTYPSGKKGWVKACKVGDASKGVVFKDYEVKQ